MTRPAPTSQPTSQPPARRPKLFRPFTLFTAVMALAAMSFAFRVVNELSVVTQGGSVLAANAEEAAAPGATPVTPAKDAAKDAGAAPPAAAAATVPAVAPAPGDAAPAGAAKDAAAAKADADAAADATAKPADAAAKANAPAPQEDDAHAYSAAEIDVLQSLSKRRDELDKREKKIAEREALLDAAGQEVDHKIAELNKLKGEIEALLGKQQKMQEDRIESLVKMYETMKPKEAATIFNTLDLDVLLTVLGRMNERKAAPILAAMDPEKARLVTIRLAEQRRLPNSPLDTPDAKAAKPAAATPAAN